ncbi:MAG: IS3 family transposase [Massilia sp.]
MTQYTEQFKLSVVRAYMTGEAGYTTVGQNYHVPRGLVRRWVTFFKLHGREGLRPKSSSGRYDPAFKKSVLEHMWENKLSFGEVAAAFNVRGQCAISAWERAYLAEGIDALASRSRRRSDSMSAVTKPQVPRPDDASRTREQLLAEIEYLRCEVAVLKKLEAFRSIETRGSKEKAQIAIDLGQQFPMATLLNVCGLKRSTFFDCKKALAAPDKYASKRALIADIFNSHHGRYGYRRVTNALRNLGHVINFKTVQRLMGEMGLKSLVRPKKYRSYKGGLSPVAPNLLARQFNADKMNEKWTTDVTEFNVGGLKLYLSPVMDLFNGEIIAVEMATRPIFSMVTKMIRKAFKKLGRDDAPLLHSDQGWQYRMPLYQALLKQHGAVQSMSRKGNCHDNASMESFFAVLKTEYFYLNKFASIEALQRGLKQYIKYYNNDRIKEKLGGLSPVQYRTQFAGS